jgi:hypothetical protein
VQAADLITLTLSPDIQAKLDDNYFNNAYTLLTKLRELCKLGSNAQFFRLIRELFTLKYANPTLGTFASSSSSSTSYSYERNTEMDTYLLYIKTLNDQIDCTKVKLTLEKRALLYLTITLLLQFEPLIQL